MVSGRRGLRLSRTADIERVPSGNDPDARETVVAGLACSAVYPASVEQAERVGMATAARLMVVYTAATDIQRDWRLVTGGVDYRVRSVSTWPAAAQFVEVLLEEER